jgi:hypothetical protein
MPDALLAAPAPTEFEKYLFDLRGYLVLPGVLTAAEIVVLNQSIDALLPLEPGEWSGHVQAQSYGPTDGLNLQQIYEAGAAWEALIDRPAWMGKVSEFVGGVGTFDYHHGPLFIDENFASVRRPGEAIGLHSGGDKPTKRTQYRVHNGQFMCGQIDILMALTDIGPGDGGTMLVPGSHKANFAHPGLDQYRMAAGAAVDGAPGAIEVHMQAGDALLFVDAISHGSARRTRPGERRVAVYRYGPSWGRSRHGYTPSPALLQRLTPARRQIVHPHHALSPPDRSS